MSRRANHLLEHTEMEATGDDVTLETCLAAGALEHLGEIFVEALQLFDVSVSVFSAFRCCLGCFEFGYPALKLFYLRSQLSLVVLKLVTFMRSFL